MTRKTKREIERQIEALNDENPSEPQTFADFVAMKADESQGPNRGDRTD